MTLRERIAAWLLKSFRGPGGAGDSSRAWDTLMGRTRPTDFPALIERNTSWVYRCVDINGTMMASVPLRLYVRGDTQRFATKRVSAKRWASIPERYTKGMLPDDVREITEHPLLELLAGANERQTGLQANIFTFKDLELLGNAYWYVENGPLGVPASIWPMLGQYVRIKPGADGLVESYLYGKSTVDQVAYPAEEVIHFSYPNPRDLYYGQGPLQAATNAADLISGLAEWRQALLDNQARPDAIIEVPETTSQDEITRLHTDWQNRLGGRKKAGKVHVMKGGQKVSPITWPPKDMAALELAKFDREEIAFVFGIPMTMLQISAARAEAETQKTGYLQFTIVPRLRLVEATLNERLCPRFDDRLFLVFDNPVPEDRELLLSERTAYVAGGIMTANEVREEMGLPPLEGGDELRGKPEPAPEDQGAQDQDGKGDQTDDSKAGKALRLIHARGCSCAACRAKSAALTPEEKDMAKALRGVWEGQLAEVLEQIK